MPRGILWLWPRTRAPRKREGFPLTRLRTIFGAPSFESDRENAAASLLNANLWLMLVGAGTFEIFHLLYAKIDLPRVVAVNGLIVLSIVAMASLRRKELRTAAWLATSALFGIACVSIGLGGGITAPGTSTLLIVIVMSAMALEWKPTVVWTLLSVAAVSWFALAEGRGWLPPTTPRPPLETWFAYLVHIVAAAWLVSYSAGAFRGVLGRLGTHSVALADSEERYAQLVEQSPDVIVALDGDGVITECSAAIEKLHGYTPDEAIGRPFSELGVIPAESLQQNLDDFRSLLAGGRPRLAETQVTHRDGSVRWVEANARLVNREDGTVRVTFVIRDITARIDAEHRRAELEQQLVDARRLEALGRMAGALAHDFNNLLHVILSNTELLESGSKLPDRSLLREIRVAGGAAAELTGQLLAFAGQQVHEAETADVGASMAKIDGLLRRLLPPNTSLEIRSEGGLPPVRGDPAQLEQAIVNLVMNAQQAMPDGGTITVEISDVQISEAECARHPGASPGGHVRIAVTDSGNGMDEQTVQRIFEPFYSERKAGTGLGLATVHGTVTQRGGHVRVHSKPGEGTRFEILLPHSTRPAPLQVETVSSAQPLPGEQAVVLLVDDQPAVLSSVRMLLENRGFRVLPAESLETARAASEREPGKIDVLLTDVLMPNISGPKLAADLVATRPDMKVILMSGYTEDHLEGHEIRPGAASFISKPFSGDTLAEKIRSILSESEPIRQGAPSMPQWPPTPG